MLAHQVSEGSTASHALQHVLLGDPELVLACSSLLGRGEEPLQLGFVSQVSSGLHQQLGDGLWGQPKQIWGRADVFVWG